MKKKLVNLMLLFVVITSIKTVKAVDFPNKIYVSHSELLTKNGWSLYKKTYVTANGDSSGKAFCASFWNSAPGGKKECSKTNWTNNTTNNVKASAAIGYIIDKVRSDNSSISWDNYYYGELAINKFLYEVGLGGEVNNISRAPKQIHNKISGYVANAKAVYNTYYNNDKIVVSDYKLNGKSIGGTITVSEAANGTKPTYKLTAVMKCYDKDKGNQVKCDLPLGDGSYTGSATPLNPIITYNGKNVIFTYDVTNAIKNGNVIKVNFSNRRAYKYAQRYNCGGGNQTMVPNYLVSSYSNRKSESKSFNVVVNTPPPGTPKTCEQQLADNPHDNSVLYQEKYSNKSSSEYYPRLLDINSPGCSGLEQAKDLSCEKSTVEREWVDQIKVIDNNKVIFGGDGEQSNHYTVLCKATYNFDNRVSSDNSSKKNSLIYKTASKDDNVFGRAIIDVDCNAPYLSGNYLNEEDDLALTFDLNDFVPSVDFEVDFSGNKVNAGLVSIVSNLSDCTLSGNSMTCNTYSKEDNGWNFTINVDYVYNSNNHYMISKQNGTLIPWSADNDSYGYGIMVPSDVGNIDPGEAVLTFDKDKKTMFFKDSNTTKCEFKIQNNDTRKNIKYRTINTENPFNKIDGTPRATGSNWCSDDATPEEEMVEADTSNSKCLYLGDVNRNNEWDVEDAEMISKYAADKIIFDAEQISLGDYNQDGRVDILDAVQIKKIVAGKIRSVIGDVNLNGTFDTDDITCITNGKCEKGSYAGKKLNGYQRKMADANGDCLINDVDVTIISSLASLTGNDSGYAVDNDSSPLDENENKIKENTNAERCRYNNNTVKKYITDRPNANGKKPIYSFTLDAATIKMIRESDDNSFIQQIYNNSSGLCLEQTNLEQTKGYCDVDAALRTGGVIG